MLRRVFDDAKLYRIGGDEFIAVVDKPSYDFSSRFTDVDRLMTGESIASVARGFAVYEPETDMGYRMVFNRADIAMYNNKKDFYAEHEGRAMRLSCTL